MRVKEILFFATMVGVAGGYAWSKMPSPTNEPSPDPKVEKPKPTTDEIEHSAYYPNCRAAWGAGHAPIFKGQPGYREELDGDGDGIACEPIRS